MFATRSFYTYMYLDSQLCHIQPAVHVHVHCICMFMEGLLVCVRER